MKKLSKMEIRRIKSGSIFYIVAVVLIISNTYVNSAPTSLPSDSSNNVAFWDSLYRNASGQGCDFVPRVNSEYESSFRSKINSFCNTTSGDPNDLKKSSLPLSNVCTSLQSLFPALCKSSLSNLSRAKINTSVELKEINALGATEVCAKLKDAVNNISKSLGVDKSEKSRMVLFLQPEGNGDQEECSKLCQHIPKDTFKEFELQVNPACILLLKGYGIYQQIEDDVTRANPKLSLEPVVNNIEEGDDATSIKSAQLKKDDPLVPISIDNLEIPTSGNVKDNPKTSALLGNEAKPEVDDLNKLAENTEEKSKDPTTQGEAIKVFDQPAEPASTQKSEPSKSVTATTMAAVREPITGSEEKIPSISEKTHPDGNTVVLEDHKVEVTNMKESPKASSTTVPSVDRRPDELPQPPIGDERKNIKSSTVLPNPVVKSQDTEKKLVDQSTSKGVPVDNDMPAPPILEPIMKPKQPVEKPNLPTKLDEDDAIASVGEEEDYDPEVDIGVVKPPVSSKKEVDNANAGSAVFNFDENASFKPTNARFPGNGFGNGNGLPFEGRGTTINVSVSGAEDTGFFNYFLFCVTLVGLLYLVIHNKKKLIAYVVEGKRPRGRSTARRSSTSSQYRRLENNFD